MLRITLYPHTPNMQRDRSSSWFGGPERAPAIVLDQAVPGHPWGRLASLGMVLLVLASLLRLPATALLQSKLDPSLWGAAHDHSSATIPVIVRETDPRSEAAEALVRGLGGTVIHELPIIGSFSARLPAQSVPALASSPSVWRVWADGRVHATSDTTTLNSQAANTVWQKSIRLIQARNAGYDGSGVTVALLDTGVNDVADLTGRVVARVDFTPERDGLDHYGHGTHMAGIIAGDGTLSNGTWTGVAPQSKLVSVKVAGADGSTDVSVVIAGLQWISSHRTDYNIRIVNISFGTDSRQSYLVDPLDYAVEQLWFSGIFVSVAAGNRGPDAGTINKPGDDPFVQTVGAADLNNTVDQSDDEVATFSSRGPTQDGFPKPAIVSPGITIVSLRAVGSTIDQRYAAARVGDSYFKGTGTSQAAAIVSGVAALMFQAKPALTVDVAKATLKGTAKKTNASQYGLATGLVDAFGSADAAAKGYFTTSPANVGLTPSTGTGSIELSRGSYHVYADLPTDGLRANDVDGQLDLVSGEIDALGNPWRNVGWGNLGWANSAWTNMGWTGTGWSNNGWSGTSWSNLGWDNNGWDNLGWDNLGWLNDGWMNNGWQSNGWGRYLVRNVIDSGLELIEEPC